MTGLQFFAIIGAFVIVLGLTIGVIWLFERWRR